MKKSICLIAPITVLLLIAGIRAAEDAASDAGFVPMFNGKDLAGWEGNMKLWSAESGEIVGKSPGIHQNEFLATTASYGDFVMKFKFRLVNTSGEANSGMQFRSKRVPNSTEVSGYQADVGQDYWGGLYDESRRNKTLVKPPKDEIEKAIHRDGWNEYVITAQGAHIVQEINGYKCVDYTEPGPADQIPREGICALQIHAGGPMEIHAKDLLIKRLDSK